MSLFGNRARKWKRCPRCKGLDLQRQGYGTRYEQARELVHLDSGIMGYLIYAERRLLHGQRRWRCNKCQRVFWTRRNAKRPRR